MFWLDGDATSPCPCCGEVHTPYDDIGSMAVACTALVVRRMAGPGAVPDAALHVLGVRSDTPDFVEYELEAALALAEDAFSLIPEVEALFAPLLTEAMRAEDVYRAMEQADSYWRRSSFSKGTASRFEEAITLAVATGVVNVSDAVAVDAVFRRRIVDGMVRASKYYSNEFFNRQVMPSLITAVERALSGDTPGSVAGYRFVQATLNARLKSVPYWSTVANAAASRAYHYGMSRAGLAVGKTRYQFVAVVDDRTSQVCRFLNGREWTITSAVDLMERIAAADNPEEVKAIAPWPKYDELKDKSEAEMADMGCFIPPLHGRCRSTIRLL